MSRIYFHSPSGTAELRGSERAYMSNLCNDMLLSSLRLVQFPNAAWLKPMIPAESSLHRCNPAHFTNLAVTYLCTMNPLIVDSKTINTFSVALNTACVIGNDAMRLLARLHGQCEIHCYVKGPNRLWLASLMRNGRTSGLYREDQGWESVIELLESRDDETVVCSYSVTNLFPNRELISEGEADLFDKLSLKEQFALCLSHIPVTLELTPEDFSTYYFDEGYSGFDIREK